MKVMNLNYEPEDPNETHKFPRCRYCFNDDTERCADCILNDYNPKTIFKLMTVLSPYEILINKNLKQEDLKLVSTDFIKQFVESAFEEFREVTEHIDANMQLINQHFNFISTEKLKEEEEKQCC